MVRGLRVSNELGPLKLSMFNVQATSDDEIKILTIECNMDLTPKRPWPMAPT